MFLLVFCKKSALGQGDKVMFSENQVLDQIDADTAQQGPKLFGRTDIGL